MNDVFLTMLLVFLGISLGGLLVWLGWYLGQSTDTFRDILNRQVDNRFDLLDKYSTSVGSRPQYDWVVVYDTYSPKPAAEEDCPGCDACMGQDGEDFLN